MTVDGQDWIALCADPFSVADATAWAVEPRCGAVVVFTGTVRDHAEGRHGVVSLEYEAYEGPAADRMRAIAEDARVRWPVLGRIALLHRTGRLEVTDTAVVVVVAAPHRDEAFEAARWCIDTLKATVPIWKREAWAGGADWGADAVLITDG
jgi:molybdopterin synthase catalytic subunit